MDLKPILAAYFNEEVVVKKLGGGLVNQTYLVASRQKKMVLQRINDLVFRSPLVLINNYQKVYEYLQQTPAAELCVAMLPTISGQYFVQHEGYWRAFNHVALPSYQTVQTIEQAYEAALAFAKFQFWLKDFPHDQLVAPLPGFCDYEARWRHFSQACIHAPSIRSEAAVAIETLHAKKKYIEESIGLRRKCPLRMVHNDPKISNLLFGPPHKVIDWDTLDRGYLFQDMGDMIRTFSPSADENETSLDQVQVRSGILKAIFAALGDVWKDTWTKDEKNAFIYSGKLYFYVQALRFMTDYLQGNRYYQTAYPTQNLDRCMNQLHCLKQLESLPKIVLS